MKYWEIIADNLSKAGWSWGCVAAIDHQGRTMWIADANRDNGKRFMVHADEKLTAFGELECAIRRVKAQGGFVITPPRRSKTLGGNRGPKLSASYRDDGEADCRVPAVALLEATP